MIPAQSPIIVRFAAAPSTMVKHTRLRHAIVGAIEAGELSMGTKIVGERELSAALGVSLGTAQKALGQLVNEGFLVRRQGHGTYVGSVRRPITGSWHFRFVGADGGIELPVFTSVTERRIETGEGPWSIALGADPKGYVMIRRSIDVDGKFRCASELYLPASRFARLLRMAQKRFTDTNLKTILADEFAAPTLQSQGLAHVVRLDKQTAEIIGVASGVAGIQLDVTGRSFGRIPITFQRISVPQTSYALKLDFNPPGTDAGDI
jgi:DNA-binding GntR family transcriptional regulator